MKFFTALLSFGAIASGFVANAASIPKRAPQPLAVAAGIDLQVGIQVVTKLLADVRVVTGNINSTLVSVTEETKGDIIAEINVSVGHITSLVNGVVAELEGKIDIDADVDVEVEVEISLEGLVSLVAQLLIEISATLAYIIKVLGLDCLINTILSGLIAALQALLFILVKLPCSCAIGSLLELVLEVVGGTVGSLVSVLDGVLHGLILIL